MRRSDQPTATAFDRLLATASRAAFLVAVVYAGCVTPQAGAGAALADTAGLDPWESLLNRFPSCHTGLGLDRSVMERRIEENAAPLQPSVLSDAGIDPGARWCFPVCRFSLGDAPFVGLIIESRGGAGGYDQEYRLLTRTLDGAPIGDTVIASFHADCSFERVVEARLSLPLITITDSYTAFDCERDTVVSRHVEPPMTLAIARSGALTINRAAR